MKPSPALLLCLCVSTALAAPPGYTLIGWNDLGMHCMDGDYSVFSILPPFNNPHAQLIDSSGRLVRSATGIRVTYAAIADADGSINTTSIWKTNFWKFVKALFGAGPAPDTGLTGNAMPGSANQPQPMKFDPAYNWFIADGVPITPYDDMGNRNPYPMVRLTATDSAGRVLATTDIVLPVSDEMDCRACHGSGSRPDTKPAAGWANAGTLERDYKINILRLHDDRTGTTLAASAAGGTPVLCGSCHATNALGTTGVAGVAPLTTSLHGYHAHVTDPVTGATLDSAQNRDACYRCHPGSQTRCLRGVMGNSVAADGTLAIQCQDCHGGMSVVGGQRQGWFDEPNCQACHTGTATRNAGQIRFTSALVGSQLRQPADTTFATVPNTPAAGISLYRFSAGHGGLQCEACHGATHAEYPSSHDNDNVQSVKLQGHIGTVSECATACHGTPSNQLNGGPHGMHVTGQTWVSRHPDYAERSISQCQPCHGADYRGTVLSRALGDRTLSAGRYGTKPLFRGAFVSCYLCHNGPGGEGNSPGGTLTVAAASASTTVATPVTVQLASSGGTLRVVGQPAAGTVALSGNAATYRPFAGFEGSDTFTVASYNGMVNSNLASVSLNVAATQRPALTAAGVVNAASYKGGGVAPGEMVTIFGAGLGPGALTLLQVNSANMISRLLADTRVIFDGMACPIIYTSAGQVTAMVPFSVAGNASTQIQVEYQGIRSTPVTVPVVAALPGIFSRDATGSGPGAILNQDGVTLNSAAHPAPRGSVVSLFVTGEGMPNAQLVDGQLAAGADWSASLPIRATIDGLDAPVEYKGAAPGMVAGFSQINITIPGGAPTGSAIPVVISAGNAASQTSITLAIK